MSHTPGPWEYDGLFTIFITDSAGNEWHIASIKHHQDEVSKANARLIAAAPELLEACQAAFDWLGRFGAHAPIIFGGEQHLHDILHAAIAKAKGETP